MDVMEKEWENSNLPTTTADYRGNATATCERDTGNPNYTNTRTSATVGSITQAFGHRASQTFLKRISFYKVDFANENLSLSLAGDATHCALQITSMPRETHTHTHIHVQIHTPYTRIRTHARADIQRTMFSSHFLPSKMVSPAIGLLLRSTYFETLPSRPSRPL